MSDTAIYDIPSDVAGKAHISNDQYMALYERSISDPDGFWAEQAEQFVHWFKKWDSVRDCDFSAGHIKWFEGGQLNAAYNCLDRHLETKGDQTAIIWESDDGAAEEHITFRQLHAEVCRFANVLKSRGVH